MSDGWGATLIALMIIIFVYGFVGFEWHISKLDCEKNLNRYVYCTWQPPNEGSSDE